MSNSEQYAEEVFESFWSNIIFDACGGLRARVEARKNSIKAIQMQIEALNSVGEDCVIEWNGGSVELDSALEYLEQKL